MYVRALCRSLPVDQPCRAVKENIEPTTVGRCVRQDLETSAYSRKRKNDVNRSIRTNRVHRRRIVTDDSSPSSGNLSTRCFLLLLLLLFFFLLSLYSVNSRYETGTCESSPCERTRACNSREETDRKKRGTRTENRPPILLPSCSRFESRAKERKKEKERE